MTMFEKLVTLCLLITYHWHGSTADSTTLVRAVPGSVAARAGIAGEVNGSPTDARLNIPVVKRSSNQAGFANELQYVVVERARNVESLPPTLFEYENLNGKKLTTKKVVATEKVVEPFVVVFKRLENRSVPRTEEITKVDRGIKSRIVDRAPKKLVARRLIGKTNFPRATSNDRRGFHYVRESVSSKLMTANDRRNVKTTGNGDDTKPTKWNKKFVEDNGEENDSAAIVSSVFVSDVSRPAVRRTRRDAKPRDQRKKEYENSLVSEPIDNKFMKQKKEQSENYDVDRMSLGSFLSLPSLKPIVRHTFERSKFRDNGDFSNVIGSRRLHQQSRNTKPQILIQHRRKNVKRHTTFDSNELSKISTFIANGNEKLFNNLQIPNSPSSTNHHRNELRFVPSDPHRGNHNRIYFQRLLKPLPFFETIRNNASVPDPFPSNDVAYPQKIAPFDVDQIMKLKYRIKGVFDKYETKHQLPTNLFPNVRIIEPEQIFVTPQRSIYDSKILPAPFSFDPYFPEPSDVTVKVNDNDNDDVHKENRPITMDQVVKGVFDQTRETTEPDHRDVIPVMEDTTLPSITNPRNFVTPLPDHGISVGDVFAMRENHPNVDSNVRDETYRITGKLRIPESENERKRDDEDDEADEHEDSRMNDKSVVEAGVEHRFVGNHGSDVRGSSYEDGTGTSDNHGQTGSTNVDHLAVIGEANDEFVNRSSAIPRRAQSYGTSSDNMYDRGSYKSRDNDDRNRYAGNYSFGYRVSDRETENEFGHRETRNDGITTGQYHVRLPDGRLQKVNYHVDDEGYHASVAYHYEDNDE